MRTRKRINVISGLIVMVALMVVPMARADESNQASQLTFNRPVEIPGQKILPAGTYWFTTTADGLAFNDNVVQIFNADRTNILAAVSTVATQRATPTARTEINLAESRANQPDALVSWFYPGRTTGHEFVYGRQEEKVVASEPVLKVLAGQAAPAYGD